MTISQQVRISLFLFLFLGMSLSVLAQGEKEKYTISGSILDSESKEPLIGVTVAVPSLSTGVVSNEYGFYSLTLPKGSYELVISYIGKTDLVRQIDLSENTTTDFELADNALDLGTVVVTAKPEVTNTGKPVAIEKVSTKKINEIPSLLGEPNVVNILQMLPGVSSSSETGISFSVRGGSNSQNLILLDEAPIYSPTHLYGLVSAFNTYSIKSVDFYKSAIPSEFQAGASSITSIYTKDGNKTKYKGELGVGFLSAHGSIEGPIVKEKSSFIFSARKSVLPDLVSLTSSLGMSYYDLNGKINFPISPKTKILISAYNGQDLSIVAGGEANSKWRNTSTTVTAVSILTDKIFLKNSIAYSNYLTSFSSIDNQENIESGSEQVIRSFKFKNQFKYYPSTSTKILFGISADYQDFLPFTFFSKDLSADTSIQTFNFSVKETALEIAPYISWDQEVNSRLSLYAGLRLPVYSWLPNAEERIYYDFDEKTVDTISQSLIRYVNLEPRIGLTFRIDDKQTVRGGYQLINQTKHNFPSGSVFSVTTFWKPSSNFIKPEVVNQFFLGYSISFLDYIIDFDTYYKKLKNVHDFKNGSSLLLSGGLDPSGAGSLLELGTLLGAGEGDAKGIELRFRKMKGSLTGDLAYTLSSSRLKIDGINNGNWYPSIFDKRHSLSLSTNYRLTERSKIGMVFNFSSGQPVDIPNTLFEIQGIDVSINTTKNSITRPNYHRLDISYILESKADAKYPSRWVFSILNVYNKFNPTFYSIEANNIYASNLIPILPSVSYQIKF